MRQHRLENRPDRHFGFTKADIATDQPIHRAITFHIPLHILSGFELVGGRLVRKGVFHLLLPGLVEGIGIAPLFGTSGIEFEEIKGNLLQGFAHLSAGFLPGFARHFA